MNKKTIAQMAENEMVNRVNMHLDNLSCKYMPIGYTRLKSCQAWTYCLANFVVLVSYNTEIACIDGETGVCYDYLRKVYGYTATSAQHISKFMKQYGVTKKVTYRPI